MIARARLGIASAALLLLSSCSGSITKPAAEPATHDPSGSRPKDPGDEPPPAVRDVRICSRPPDYVVETADKATAASLARRYGRLFGAEQAGVRVLLRSRPDDEGQRRELELLSRDPNYRITPEARFEFDGAPGPDPLQTFNEPLWNAIRRPAAEPSTPGEPVNVAVLDGLVRGDHPDLPEVVQIVPRLRDEDGNCEGGDCCPRTEALPGFWHATRVAGVIGAQRGNGVGVAGIAPVRRIVSINADVDGCVGEFSLAAALHCAIEYRDADGRRARVANISMGSMQTPASQALDHALQRALNEDLLIVASAGNKGDDIDSKTRWPSSLNLDNILTVEARDYDGNRIGESNFGFGTVDIGAPAPAVASLCTTNMPESGYGSCSGDYGAFGRTSAAAAIVSGAAALIWSDPRFAACGARQMSQLLRHSRSRCLAGHSYRRNRDYEVCQLDLGFLALPDAAELQTLCAGGR